MTGNGVYLFDGGDLSKSLFRLVLVALQEGFDILLHSLAHAVVVALLPARQKQQSQQQHSSTHHVNLLHAAVALQALSNQTTAHISQIVVPLHHTLSQAPPAPSIKSHSHPHFTHAALHEQCHIPPPPHMPLLTKSIFFRRLNRPRLAHSG